MPFNRHDIYTSSGSVQLFNEWVPYVSKFDTSSFYNWEQDNLPLYDLEERTYELWEQNGYNTSAGVPGLALTVSADAGTTVEGQAVMAANRNVFTQLSSCIAAIPKVVRFPVLVEVGSFGDLGDLELHNFRIEEGGSIEIINRNFSRALDASSDNGTNVTPPVNTKNASHALVRNIKSALDISGTLTDASCMGIETLVMSAGNDERVADNSNSFIYPDHTSRKAPLSVAFDQTSHNGNFANIFTLTPYEAIVDSGFDNTQALLDASSENQATGSRLYRAQVGNDNSEQIGGNLYYNKLGKITVKNCDGPIFIRNFFVDASKDSGTSLDLAKINEYGIEVTNSDVLIENCGVVRAKDSGWKFNNSKVILSRSAFSYRNYKLTSTASREADTGYGFHAVNSDVSISSLPIVFTPSTSATIGDVGASGADCKIIASRNYAGFVLDNSRLTGGVQRAVAATSRDSSILASELNTGYGFLLDNSKVDVKGLIDIYGNDRGIKADNSKFKFENLCLDAQGNEGIQSRTSQFIFDSPQGPTQAGQSDRHQLDMSANGQHIDLQANSLFTFERKNNMPQKYGNSKFLLSHGVIKWNGSKKSTLPAISVNDGSIADLIHPNINVSGTPENIENTPSYGRAIKAENSSKVSLFGSETGCNFIYGPPGRTYQQKMAGVYANNNSTVNLHGPTAMAQFGVDALVENNSVLNIEPARKRDAFGLEVSGFDLSSGANHTSVELHATRACLVANKNSTINMQDLGSWPVNWGRTSTGSVYLTAGTDYNDENTFDTSAFTSSGCLQFYPNPQDTSAIDDLNLDDLTVAAPDGHGFTIPTFPVFTTKVGLNRFFATQEVINTPMVNADVEHITQGGVCVRATQDSTVNVKNVHFPCGTNDSPLDGFYYTTSGDLCDRFMIWNMADTSRLNASYLSVSGMHPASIQYHGPSSIWASSVNGVATGPTGQVPASGAPNGTPGTGNLSILDVFGAGSGVWVVPSGVDVNSGFDRFYPISAAVNDETASALSQGGINVSGMTKYRIGASENTTANQGGFRIYWTPKSYARALMTDLSGYHKGAFNQYTGNFSGVLGPAYQLFSQGYNCSADLSAVEILDGGNNIVSSVYPEILRLSHDSDGDGTADKLHTSGFYYCADVVETNPNQCILDESAAKSFANAQNASVGIGGTPIKVTLIRARANSATNRFSESYVGDVSGSLGFKSSSIFDLSRDN